MNQSQKLDVMFLRAKMHVDKAMQNFQTSMYGKEAEVVDGEQIRLLQETRSFSQTGDEAPESFEKESG